MIGSFSCISFDLEVGGAINELHSNTLTHTILKVDFVCDVAMMSIPNVNYRHLHDLLYNQVLTIPVVIRFYLPQESDKGM